MRIKKINLCFILALVFVMAISMTACNSASSYQGSLLSAIDNVNSAEDATDNSQSNTSDGVEKEESQDNQTADKPSETPDSSKENHEETTEEEKPNTVKNIIIVIGDGMGAEHIAAGELVFNKHYGFTDWNMAMVNTDSLMSDGTAAHTTDSAAAATAIATGTLTTNGYVGKSSDGSDLETILDTAKEYGKSTGIVTTDKLYGGTPAGFSAHTTDRTNKSEVLMTQLDSGVDLLCGASSNSCTAISQDIIAKGYEFCNDFSRAYKYVDKEKAYCTFDMNGADKDVKLKDATGFALDFLSKDEDGFVLVVEQAHIDKYSHNNDFESMVKCVNYLNDTVEMLESWAEERMDTAIFVTADHETGNLSVSSSAKLENGYLGDFGTVNYTWKQTSHSYSDVPFFVYGYEVDFSSLSYYHSSHLIKNTDIAYIVREIITKEDS